MSSDGCHSLDVSITSDQPAPASFDCVVAQLSSFRLTQSVSASRYHSAYLFVLRKLVHVTSFCPTIGATTRYKACTRKAARVNARVVESLLWLASSIMSHHTGTTVDDSSCHVGIKIDFWAVSCHHNVASFIDPSQPPPPHSFNTQNYYTHTHTAYCQPVASVL
jgi:hypothetical protein